METFEKILFGIVAIFVFLGLWSFAKLLDMREENRNRNNKKPSDMPNTKTILLANLPTEEAIKLLKEECTPKGEICLDNEKRCKAKAGKDVLDDWGDSCEGNQCCLEDKHSGNHMASDGANGWVYFN